MNINNNQKHSERLTVSYILAAAGIFGICGLQRLYNGKVGTGLLWFFTFGCFYIGQFVDVFLIPGMVDEYEQNLRLKAGLSPLGVPVNQPINVSQVHPPTKEQLMMELLTAAEANGGCLTVTKGVKATGASFAKVEAVLKEMLKSGYVTINNDSVTGAVTYHFHEL